MTILWYDFFICVNVDVLFTFLPPALVGGEAMFFFSFAKYCTRGFARGFVFEECERFFAEQLVSPVPSLSVECFVNWLMDG